MKHFLVILLCSTLILSCEQSIEDRLVGTWQNTSLDVTMAMPDGQDSLMHIEEGQWEEVLRIKPIVTRYTVDGKFVSDYYTPEGKSLGSELGDWEIRNDSLILKSTNYKWAYKVTFDGNKARFTSLLDWDQDGLADDLYDGWQEKLEK
jgi:hypothetical protein